MKIKELRNRLERHKGQREQLEKDIVLVEDTIKQNKKNLRAHERAKDIVRQIALKTQEQLSFNIEEITSLALNAVLDDPYDLELSFVEKRGKTECDIWFARDGNRIDPLEGGGGAVNIAAFALRVASWSMQKPMSRNLFMLDEPFSALKGEKANVKALKMIKELSGKLNIQIIMVSDERVSREETIKATDKLFKTRIKKGITKIKEL